MANIFGGLGPNIKIIFYQNGFWFLFLVWILKQNNFKACSVSVQWTALIHLDSAAFVPHICRVKQWPFSSSGIWSLTLSSVSKQLLTGAHLFVKPICSTVLYPCLPSLGGSHGEDLMCSLLLGFLPQHLMFAWGESLAVMQAQYCLMWHMNDLLLHWWILCCNG